MKVLSLNEVVHGRILSDQKLRSIVLRLTEKYGLSPEQGEMFVGFAGKLVSISRTISLPRENQARKQKLSAELDLVLDVVRSEKESFGEAFWELLRDIEREISDVSP